MVVWDSCYRYQTKDRKEGGREGGREEVVVLREELPLIDYEG